MKVWSANYFLVQDESLKQKTRSALISSTVSVRQWPEVAKNLEAALEAERALEP